MAASATQVTRAFPPDFRVAGAYVLGRKIGSGSFGDIYHGSHVTSKKEVAIKFERFRTKHPQLLYEAKLLRRLQGGEGIAALHYSGVVEIGYSANSRDFQSEGTDEDRQDGDRKRGAAGCRDDSSSSSGETETESFNVMVTELLGPTVEDLFNLCSRKFTITTTMFIAEQMVQRLDFLHTSSFIHRDIKPENFLIGRGERNQTIYIIDFGLAKRYCDPRTGEHIPYREDKSLTGTARYASINAHLGIEQSRRDDMEAAGHVILYLARGGMLPWQGLKATTKQEKYKLIMERKLSTPIDTLCHGLPRELGAYLRYCHGLRFVDSPDYLHLGMLLKTVRQRADPTGMAPLDWMGILTNKSEVSKKLHKLGFPANLPPQFEKEPSDDQDVVAEPRHSRRHHQSRSRTSAGKKPQL